MRNLFDPTRLSWPQLHDSLHVYALPDSRFAASMEPATAAIRQFEYCAPVAPQWMHAAVTRIPWWRGEIGEAALRRFGETLDAVTAGIGAFSIPMVGPVVHDTSVGVVGEAGAEWGSLLDRTRAAAEQVFGDVRPMPPAPPVPHVSLGYGIEDCDSGGLEQALRTVDVPAALEVAAVYFLAVHANPEDGTFTWDTISSHALATVD